MNPLQLYSFNFNLNHREIWSPKWQLNQNFSRQGENVSHIGDGISRSFKPCTEYMPSVQYFDLKIQPDMYSFQHDALNLTCAMFVFVISGDKKRVQGPAVY